MSLWLWLRWKFLILRGWAVLNRGLLDNLFHNFDRDFFLLYLVFVGPFQVSRML